MKEALELDSANEEAASMANDLREEAERLRNSGVIFGLNNRLLDGIEKLTRAIEYNPDMAEYHLQRGVLFKRRRDFNSAIDDFLLGMDKLNKNMGETNNVDSNSTKQLLANFQRQVLLTYNDFGIQCYEKGYYDDAIVLLNKAIRIEKAEKGFYVNRGGWAWKRCLTKLIKNYICILLLDCFYRKNDKKYALLDYEQANEIDPNDEEIKNRIAKIYYEFGVEKYNEKKYQVFSKYMDIAVN